MSLEAISRNMILLAGIIIVGVGATLLGTVKVFTGQQVLTVYMAIISFVFGEKLGEARR